MNIIVFSVGICVFLFIVVCFIIAAYQDYNDKQKKIKQNDWYYNMSAYIPEHEYNLIFAGNCGRWYYDTKEQGIFCCLEKTTKWHRNYKIEVLTSKELENCNKTNLIWFQQDGKYYIAIYAWKTAETEESYQAALRDQANYERKHPEVKRNSLLQEQNNLLQEQNRLTQQHQRTVERQLENTNKAITGLAAITFLNGINRR